MDERQPNEYKLCDFGSATTVAMNYKDAKSRAMAETDIEKNTTIAYRSPEMCDLFMVRFEFLDIYPMESTHVLNVELKSYNGMHVIIGLPSRRKSRRMGPRLPALQAHVLQNAIRRWGETCHHKLHCDVPFWAEGCHVLS